MDEQLKKDAHLLCEKIRELTLELDKKIENISNDTKKAKYKNRNKRKRK